MIPVLLSLVAIICNHCSNAQSLSCPCLSESQFVEILQAKGIVRCYDAVNNLTSIGLSGTPKRIITGISWPIDMIQVGNDIYVTARAGGSIYRYDQDGNQLEVIPLTPSGTQPKFLVLHENKIYVTTVSPAQILVSSDVSNGAAPLSFTQFLNLGTLNPNQIRFTLGGNQFILGTSNNQINVYNTNDLSLEKEISISQNQLARDIQFDAFGNVYVSTEKTAIKVYSPEYEFIRDITYPNAQRIDGFMFQCDGSKIIVDQAQKIFVADRDDNIVDTVTIQGLTHNAPLRNILFTSNGNIFVNSIHGNRIFVY